MSTSEPSSESKPPPIPGRLGLYLAVVAIAFPVVSGIIQMQLDTQRGNADRELEKLKFDQSMELERAKNDNAINAENNRNRFEVNKLFLDNYQGAKAKEQLGTVRILVTLYPKEFVGIAKLFQIHAATPGVKARVQKAEESAQTLAQQPSAAESGSKVPTAASEELLGFRLVIKGDLAQARDHFVKAYTIFPTYHNVDEISHQVLSKDLIANYKTANPKDAQDIRQEVATEIVDKYSWGIPRSELKSMRKLAH